MAPVLRVPSETALDGIEGRAGGGTGTLTVPRGADADELADAVRAGLSGPVKQLPPRFFYDEVGCALFEAICRLPEYGLTRADQRILTDSAEAYVAAAGWPTLVVELGSGTGRKTRPILESLPHPALYLPIDVSADALEQCAVELHGVEGVRIEGLAGSYLSGLDEAVSRRTAGERLLVLFLGSSIGNFEPAEAAGFLGQVRARLRPGDSLLLGTDLQSNERMLRAAYDDPAGVTAAFNLNLLSRLNRELAANFDVRRWRHFIRWDPAGRIEMHLVSEGRQWVTIPGAGVEAAFSPGESIWTESSWKFTADSAIRLGKRAGFRAVLQRTDREWPFAETLFSV